VARQQFVEWLEEESKRVESGEERVEVRERVTRGKGGISQDT